MSKILRFSNVWVRGWGQYVPSGRVSAEEVGRGQGRDGKVVGEALGVMSKAVALDDEDAVTLAWEASSRAIGRGGVDKAEIGSVYVGSESHPYAVKPSMVVLARALGLGNDLLGCDLEFACKAGTSGVLIVAAQVEAGLVEAGLAVGSDVSQARPGDVLEFSAGAGAGAVVLGFRSSIMDHGSSRKNGEIKPDKQVRLVAGYSYVSDTSDFWRRQHSKYPSHGGRFTGEPGYFGHVVVAAKRFLEGLEMEISDIDRVVLHMPNGKFPKKAAKKLGVSREQLEAGFGVEAIGNAYSGTVMIGLARTLDAARPGEKVLVVSYGSGAGSDCLLFKVTSNKQQVTNSGSGK